MQEALDELVEGCTVFVVAHRLSTIRKATQILVLEEGRILERGNHNELMSLDGRYAHGVSLQQGEPTAADPALSKEGIHGV